MIIWGFQTILKTLSGGVFHCQRCAGDRQYRLCLARRWFTFFWIPIFTYRTDGRFVECLACRTLYHEDALQLPTTAHLSQLIVEGMRVLAIEVLRAVGRPGAAAKQAAAVAIAQAGLQGYVPQTVDADLASPRPDLAQLLLPLGAQLEPQGREWLLISAAQVALADGTIQPGQRSFLEWAGAQMQMSPAHVAGILSIAAQVQPRA